MNDKINLRGGWDTMWTQVSSAMPPKAQGFLLMAAAAVAAYSIFEWIVSNHGGKGGKSKRIGWGLVLAMVLAAPGLIIPIILSGIDIVGNAALSAFK